MISYILLIASVLLVVFSYLLIFIKYIMNKKKEIDNYSGFDCAKEVTANYDDINIVSSSDVIFSEYDTKRNVVRLNSKNYDGNSFFNVAVSAILAGYSLVNTHNNYYFKFKIIVKKIGYFGFSSLIAIVLSYFISNIGDAKIGLVILGILLVYQYMRYQVIVLADNEIKEVLEEDIYNKISDVINSIVNFNKISFVAMLLMILRLVVIILGM